MISDGTQGSKIICIMLGIQVPTVWLDSGQICSPLSAMLGFRTKTHLLDHMEESSREWLYSLWQMRGQMLLLVVIYRYIPPVFHSFYTHV